MSTVNLLAVVQDYFPGADNDFADYVMWNETCFPMMGTTLEGIEHYRLQLAKFKCREEFLCGGPFNTFDEDITDARRKGWLD